MKRKGFTLIELLVVIAIIFILISIAMGAGGGCGFSGTESDGSRVGIINKISHKGLFIKSWECDMLTGAINEQSEGLSVATWHFTIPENQPELIQIAQEALNKSEKISITYHQDTWYNPFRNKSGGYWLTGVATNGIP